MKYGRFKLMGVLAAFLMGTALRGIWGQTGVQKGEQAATQKYIDAKTKAFEKADQKLMPEKGAVLFTGSSSIEKWTDLAADFPEIKVINRGIGGAQIADCTRSAGKLIAPYEPRLIVFYAGDNDLAFGKTPQEVFEEYQEFVKRVRELLPSTPINFISIKPSVARAALLPQMKTANALIKNFIAPDKTQFYIDVFTPMLGDDGQPRPELFGADKLHMNREGYKLWQNIVAPYLK